ncbi:MAG: hypothetical protein ACW98D_04495 [Promethearchaeota archaeon]|jgi:hypothetical protein
MEGIWDLKADVAQEGDKLRDVSPIARKTIIDDNSYSHYIFSKQLFINSSYKIPGDDFELFKMFLEGEDLIYPSDGVIPLNIVAAEAKKVLNYIVTCAENISSPYYEDAKIAMKNGKLDLIRGPVKLYLGNFTTIDWRRKRFTGSINFFTFHVSLLDHALTQMDWVKNKETNNWEKSLQWFDTETSENAYDAICTTKNLNNLLDFVAENYFEGTSLRDIFIKKLKRGFDVDLSDIINVVFFINGSNKNYKEEWSDVWESFEVTTNTRNTRITSNIISLCRYSLGIADHLDRVSRALATYHGKIFDKKEYPDESLRRICRTSIHWTEYLEKNGTDATRNMLHEFLVKQKDEKLIYSKNLRSFTENVLKLLNSKYEYLKVIFEILK